MAADELRKEGQVPEANIGDPSTVGLAIEVALYKHFNGLTKEYKSRYRSMSFNLRDAANPDLRRRVLQVRRAGSQVRRGPPSLAPTLHAPPSHDLQPGRWHPGALSLLSRLRLARTHTRVRTS